MQNIEVVKDKINLLDYILADAPTSKVKRSGTTTQISPCPFCSKGTRTPHFVVYEASNSFSSFGCELNGKKGGSIIDYIMAKDNLDQKEAIKKLYQITNTPFEEAKPRQSLEMQKQEKKQDQAEIEQINKFCLDGFNKMQDQEKLKEYLAKRKIDAEAIRKYHLFISKLYVDNKNKDFLIIPIIEEGKAISYIGRNLDNTDANNRYRNSKGTTSLFNKQYLREKAEKENELLFICEGVFDAISIEEQGFKAISLNSTNNTKKLIDAVKENLENAKSYKFILATDTDEPRTKGKRGTTSRANKIKYIK